VCKKHRRQHDEPSSIHRSKELPGLMARWRKKVGTAMPIDIASLPLEKIKSAVRHVEAGNIVVVPKGLSLGEPRHATEFGEDSMMEDDAHGRY
jgi:hypothetical protein